MYGRYEEMVAVETVESGSPASHADLRLVSDISRHEWMCDMG